MKGLEYLALATAFVCEVWHPSAILLSHPATSEIQAHRQAAIHRSIC